MSTARGSWRQAPLLVLLVLPACISGHEPSRPITSLELEVSPSVVVVGEKGYASVMAWTTEGCWFETPCSMPVGVRVGSSNPNIILVDIAGVRAPGGTTLTALSPGTARISAKADDITTYQQVEVVAAPDQ